MADMFRPLRLYATFAGRARRREFWSFTLLLWALLLLLMYLDSALALGGTATSWAERSDGGVSVGFRMTGGILTLVGALALIVPALAVSVRRLHDLGKSGWLLLAGLIPLFGWLYLLYLDVQPGQTGANAYGPDPKGAAAAPAAA